MAIGRGGQQQEKNDANAPNETNEYPDPAWGTIGASGSQAGSGRQRVAVGGLEPVRPIDDSRGTSPYCMCGRGTSNRRDPT